jgi:sulfate adenylyltransferase large subunit
MTVRPDPSEFVLADFIAQQERKSLLRFIVCGSVDHGKSTLIGRLLYEAKLLFDDQLDGLNRDSRAHATNDGDLDFSLLLDGLAAEREQKITIDVAYRFFTTERRKFIVADAPGHEQYTRNMATGASTADLALLLVSAGAGLTRQTKRHALIVSMLGVRHFVVAVNKMDLVGWSRERFDAIKAEFRAFAEGLDVDDIVFIPMAARGGDNVVTRSQLMGWYRGPSLLEHLELVKIAPRPRQAAFRLPVQWVNRPDANFRGYSGPIAGGEVHAGMPVQVLPSGQTTRIERIVTADGDLERAFAGQAVTLTLADDVDASRGDVIAALGPPAPVTNRFAARMVWMDNDALVPGRSYLLKLGTNTATARVEPSLRVLNLDTSRSTPAERLASNDIGSGVLALDRLIALDTYADNRETGSFILIAPESGDTVGMGIVEATHVDESRTPMHVAVTNLIRSTESHARSVVKAVSWRTTGSIDTFLVTFIISGSAHLAGGVALTEIVTKIAFYYLHERIWALVPWGRR